MIGHLGGVHDLLTALKNHNSIAQLCSTCLNALWGLSVYGKFFCDEAQRLSVDAFCRFVIANVERTCFSLMQTTKIQLSLHIYNMSRVVRKPAFCIYENKDADQLRGNREADQRLCFRYMDSTIPLLPKSEISSL